MTSYVAGNGTTSSRSYDLDYRISTLSTSNSLQNLSYDWDAADQLYNINNGISATATQDYDYNSLSMLLNVTSDGGDQGLTFNRNLNRETHTWGGIVDDYINTSTSNRVTRIEGSRARNFYYDTLGNLQEKTGWNGAYILGYDVYNRLNSITQSSSGDKTWYAVNAFNQRVRKGGYGGTASYVQDPNGTMLGETNGANNTNLYSQYVWLNGEVIAMYRSAWYYVYNDHLNRAEVITNSTKGPVWRAQNYAFDRTVTLNNIGGYLMGFPGQWYDSESKLWYNWNRYYDAATGRYVQSDPIGLAGGSNTYSYVGGNPVSNTDPTGLVTWEGTGAFFSAIAGGGAAFGAFQLKSECVNGSQQLAQVYAAGPAVGFGLQLTGSGGTFTFEDGRSTPDATVFNGQFLMAWAGGAAGLGYGVSSIQLGEATAPFSHGYSAGVDMSVGGTAGRSWVGFSIPLSCGCDSGGGK